MPQSSHRDADVPACTQPIPPLRIVQPQLDQVRSLMVEGFIGEPLSEPLRPLLEHTLGQTGKLIRPGLVLLSGLICGRLMDAHLGVAAVMEMIHRASLLHDDVLDCADTRRGRPSAQRLWGNVAAILLGDLVLSRVMVRCAEMRPEIGRVVAETTCRVCEGELRQTLQRAHWQITEQEYLDAIADKSASFFDACCRIGAILGGASAEQIDALAVYGQNVGMAFQMTDDVLDLMASPDEVGKPAGLDAGKGVVTLPLIHLLRTLPKADRKDMVDRLQAGENLSALLRCQMIKHGSLDYVRSRCQDHGEQAIQALNGIDDSQAKKALIELAHYSFTRRA